jgi:hypothetical protein
MTSNNIQNLIALKKIVGDNCFKKICCDLYGEVIRIPSVWSKMKWMKVSALLVKKIEKKEIAHRCNCSLGFVYKVEKQKNLTTLQSFRREMTEEFQAKSL